MTANSPRVLLVEDDEADVVHFKRMCRRVGLDADIAVVPSGDAALKHLRHPANSNPTIIVTDLNMPGLTGHEFIREIRHDKKLSPSIVFVVSTSDLPEDIDEAYSHHVAGYIVKDAHGERLQAGVEMLNEYIRAVTLPSGV